jgi:Tfp pilus assembly protein PilV
MSMVSPTPFLLLRRSAAGMTLVEALLALVLLSVCLIPAANALRSAVAVPADSALAARQLDCVSALMETVVAEPFGDLLAAAGEPDAPSRYSTSARAQCPALTVTITRYGIDRTRKIGIGGTGNHLLRVTTALAAPDGRFPLTALVTR